MNKELILSIFREHVPEIEPTNGFNDGKTYTLRKRPEEYILYIIHEVTKYSEDCQSVNRQLIIQYWGSTVVDVRLNGKESESDLRKIIEFMVWRYEAWGG